MFKIYPQWNFLKTIVFVTLFLPVLGWAQVPTNGLVAYYPFNGNANDESGNGNNGVVNGATLATDRFGTANKTYSFNGSSYIVVPDNDNLELIGDFSVSSWFYANSFNGNGVSMLLSKHYCAINEGTYTYGIWSSSSNNLVNFQASPQFNASTYPSNAGNVEINKWYNFIATYEKSTRKLKYYLNNVLVGTLDLQFDIQNNNRQLYVGMQNCSSNDWYWNGKIDDIRIYNRALSATEVTQLYNAEAPPVTLETGLVAYYPFNGNANDESGNGNNGVVNGATLTTDRFGNANKAYSFDGLSNFITIPDATNLHLTTGLTISVWVKLGNNPTQMRLIDKAPVNTNDGYLLDLLHVENQ